MALEKRDYYRYLPVSPRDVAWGVYVTNAGYVKIAANAEYPPAGHPRGYAFSWGRGRVLSEYQLHYITRGRGTFESDSRRAHRIQAGSVFLLFPGVWHRYRPHRTTGWDEYWVGFNGPWAKRLITNGFFSADRPVLKADDEGVLFDLFTQVIGALRTEQLGYTQLIGSTVTLMLAHVHAAERAEGGGHYRTEAIIREAKRVLGSNLDKDLSMPQVAGDLHVSYAWLRRMFSHYTGLAPHQYHLQMRISRAMELLAGTDLSIKEIGQKLGYRDVHYFSRVFKKKAGRAPDAWRHMSRGGGRRPASDSAVRPRRKKSTKNSSL